MHYAISTSAPASFNFAAISSASFLVYQPESIPFCIEYLLIKANNTPISIAGLIPQKEFGYTVKTSSLLNN